MSEPPRRLLVILESDLHVSRVNGLAHAFASYPGVVAVFNQTLLESITPGPAQLEPATPPRKKKR